MIGRGNGKPGTHTSVPGYSHAYTQPDYEKLGLGIKAARRQTAAQKAIIEKSQSYYFELSCGHYVAREVREIYKVFSSIDIFCEICNNWMPPKEHVTKRNYPDNPLF